MKKNRLAGSLFVLPAFALFTCLTFLPLLTSIYYGMTKWDGISSPSFTGFKNYATLLGDPDFWKTFSNTMVLLAVSLLFQVFFALILAWLLCTTTRGFKIYRTVFFLPVIVAPMAIGIMFSLFYNSEYGLVNMLLDALHLPGLKRQWLSDPDIVLGSVITPQVWQYIGMYVTIFAAAIRGIPEDVFESANIDGAGAWQTFWRIVAPMTKDIGRICVVLAVTGSLKAFDHAWAITGGGPGNASSYLAIYMYKTAFVKSNFGYASTISTAMLLISIVLSFLARKLLKTEEGVA